MPTAPTSAPTAAPTEFSWDNCCKRLNLTINAQFVILTQETLNAANWTGSGVNLYYLSNPFYSYFVKANGTVIDYFNFDRECPETKNWSNIQLSCATIAPTTSAPTTAPVTTPPTAAPITTSPTSAPSFSECCDAVSFTIPSSDSPISITFTYNNSSQWFENSVSNGTKLILYYDSKYGDFALNHSEVGHLMWSHNTSPGCITKANFTTIYENTWTTHAWLPGWSTSYKWQAAIAYQPALSHLYWCLWSYDPSNISDFPSTCIVPTIDCFESASPTSAPITTAPTPAPTVACMCDDPNVWCSR